jgi:hypothetical protein
MDYSKLINEYLEGELEIAEEQRLFSEMAYNDALREEFTDEVKLSNILAADATYETTPVEATDGVFTQLGFSIPTAAGRGAASGFWSKFSKTSVIAILLLFGTAVTSGILYFNGTLFNSDEKLTDNSNGINAVANTGIAINEDVNQINGNSLINAEGMNSFFNNLYDIVSSSFKVKDERNSTNSEFNRNNPNLYGLNKSSDLSIDSSELPNLNKSKNSKSFMKMLNQSQMHIMYSGNFAVPQMVPGDFVIIPVASDMMSNYPVNKKYSVQTKGALNSYYPNLDNINVDNMGSFEIAFWYNPNQNNSFGLTFGRSSFAQQFNTAEGIQYYQAPELFWLGASYKRLILEEELFGFIMPYSSVMAGASSIGPVLRLESGIEISVSGNFGIVLGAEGNSLLYNVDGKIYNSNNIGFIYGFKYNF